MPPKIDQPRKQIDLLIVVSNLHSQENLGCLLNINKQGLMVVGRSQVQQNQIYQVKLRSLKEGIDFELGAESIWSQHYPQQKKYLTGFNIIDISPYHEAALVDLLTIPGIQDRDPIIDWRTINPADVKLICEKAETVVDDAPHTILHQPSEQTDRIDTQTTHLLPHAMVNTLAEQPPSKHSSATDQPTHFGKYEVIDVLGQGNMGIVYRCLDPHIHRTVAIKTVSCDGLSAQAKQQILGRFSQEIKAVGRLSHPNIVSIYESGDVDGMPYFVMEYIPGKDLSQHLKERVLNVEEGIQIIKQVLDALHYSHSMGIVHRDLKPSNLFMDTQGRVKLSDFGIAKVEDTDYTVPGTVLGTPTYMSPEQCQGRTVDARTDIFSSAVVFYELLTSEQCFSANSSYTVMQNILHLHPIRPSNLNVQIPLDIDRVITKAMAKRPSDRYQSAMDFKEDLLKVYYGPRTDNPPQPLFWIGIAAAVCGAIVIISGVVWFLA